MRQNIFIASDHAGIDLKAYLIKKLQKITCHVVDLGPDTQDSVDYPDYANKLAQALAITTNAYGILICGTGIGMSIAANRHAHIRAALCHTPEEAQLSKQHNNANVLCLGARILSAEQATQCVESFLSTAFEGVRHERRVSKLAVTPSTVIDQIVAMEHVAESFGFAWPNLDMPILQIKSECDEICEAISNNHASSVVQKEVSDLLHAAISLCVFLKYDVNETLNISYLKFKTRFELMKEIAAGQGVTDFAGLSVEIMMAFWEHAKAAEYSESNRAS